MYSQLHDDNLFLYKTTYMTVYELFDERVATADTRQK